MPLKSLYVHTNMSLYSFNNCSIIVATKESKLVFSFTNWVLCEYPNSKGEFGPPLIDSTL